MSAWRQAGLNYINYSNIAAKLLRQALKADIRVEAMKRADTHIKVTKWVDGKPITRQIHMMGLYTEDIVYKFHIVNKINYFYNEDFPPL